MTIDTRSNPVTAKSPQLPPPRQDTLYHISKWIVTTYFRRLYRWKVVGDEHIPPEGPVIIASNHIHFLDPPLIGASTKRFVYFMAKVELFRWRPIALLLSRFGAFPVRRGGNDKTAVRLALSVPAHGGCLIIFPEGHRSRTGQLLPGMPGVAFIARKAQCPVVPAAVIGPYRIGRPLTVRFGPPLYPDPGDTNETLLEKLMERIQSLVAEGHGD
ncbi:MAG: 1-acyl-sn-glycerol-3-phosphate acyltransferase [Alicyclobacillaceae bacterium]|nr:1-acyl-sn-glycerol-3-phosphate acyltransferase [Alicyclobacillaceae bacterium]